jgi:hypothetical protein
MYSSTESTLSRTHPFPFCSYEFIKIVTAENIMTSIDKYANVNRLEIRSSMAISYNSLEGVAIVRSFPHVGLDDGLRGGSKLETT